MSDLGQQITGIANFDMLGFDIYNRYISDIKDIYHHYNDWKQKYKRCLAKTNLLEEISPVVTCP